MIIGDFRDVNFKPAFRPSSRISEMQLQQEKKEKANPSQDALLFVLEAWESGLAEGLERDHLANAAIFAALSDLVSAYGEQAVSLLTDQLSVRIKEGEFTFNRTIQ